MFPNDLLLVAGQLLLVAMPPFAYPLAAPVVENRPAATLDVAAEAPLSESQLREINAIRQQVGSVLGPDADNAHEFMQQMRNAFGTPPVTENRPAHAPDDAYRARSLRSLSRRLDSISHDLEDLEMFPEADEVRRIGRRLRNAARPPSPPR